VQRAAGHFTWLILDKRNLPIAEPESPLYREGIRESFQPIQSGSVVDVCQDPLIPDTEDRHAIFKMRQRQSIGKIQPRRTRLADLHLWNRLYTRFLLDHRMMMKLHDVPTSRIGPPPSTSTMARTLNFTARE
jgi:hypothetical protein